ncbi:MULTISPECIES: DNA polymerase III subunit gamma and tau [unclassified Luteococcus]|uniref:DNA polymerase III subunit gamma and tau n=1 Tax=unclassified Luteococcus TaxID=2639923 RepID=UPI00313BE79B
MLGWVRFPARRKLSEVSTRVQDVDDDYENELGLESDDDFFEQDGPGLFGGEPPVADARPAVTQEPDDGLEDDPEDELLLGGADTLLAEPAEAAVGDDAMPPESGEALIAESTSMAQPVDGPAVPTELAAPASTHQTRAVDDAPAAPLALYRRYRPETFAEVIGQEHVTDPLQRALTNNKVNHAYLFSGPRGCGKTTSARILARCLNCEQGPTPTPCGQCQSCRDLARGGNGSIDVIEIDAASHGGVDDARDLRERAFFAPVHSRYKIYIIDEAHMVTAQGFNAMLKLVEEPPPHVKFIFATTEPEKVIGTIRSRTHHYPFRLVPPKVLQNYLATLCEAEGVNVDHSVLPLVVRAGAGSVRDSLSVLDQLLGGAAADGVSYEQAAGLLGYTPDALLDEIMDAFAAGDAAGVFATIDKVIEVGQDPRRFAEDLLRRLRDLVIVAAVPDAVSSGLIDVAGDQAERLETQANGMGAGELTRAAEVMATGLTDMRGTTAPRLHLELMCSRVLLPGADVDGRGIHARLDRLERRVGMPGAPAPADPGAGQWSPSDLGGAAPHAVAQGPMDQDPAQRGAAPQPAQDASVAHDSRPLHTQPEHFDDAPPAPPAQQRPAAQPDPQAPASQPPASPGGQRPAQPGVGQGQRPAAQQGQRPAVQGQRPAASQGQRPAGAPMLGQRPAPAPGQPNQPGQPIQPSQPNQPGHGQQPAGQPPASSQAGASGSIGVSDVRRLWPQVLEEVKTRRRFAWILLSQNAQVVDVRDGVLVLGFSNPGARDRFASGGSQDVLRDCMVEVMGADLRVEAIIDGGHTGGSPGGGRPAGGPSGGQPGGGQPRGPQGGDQGMPGGQSSAQPPRTDWQHQPGQGPERPSQESDGQELPSEPASPFRGDGDPGPQTPPSAPEPPPDHVDSSRWTQQARQNIRPTASGPSAPEPEVDESQLVSDDDESLDESGESAAELITRALGGVVIAEEEASV